MAVVIQVNPVVTADQLFEFYERNGVCEVGFGKELAARVLVDSSLVVAALDGERLVGIARATFDGLSAAVMELSIECKLQGEGLTYGNGSLVEKDESGVGRRLGAVFVEELLGMGATFIDVPIEPIEREFYRSIGFVENVGQLVYYIDRRPYVGKQSP